MQTLPSPHAELPAAPADDRLALLRLQMASAAAATSRLRHVGTQEQYLRSFFLEDALELQLARLMGGHSAD